LNESNDLRGLSDVPWPTSDHRMPVPDTSMLPGSEKPVPAAVDLLKHAVRGVHETIDRVADGAAPAVRQLGAQVTAAQDALQVTAEQVKATGDAWAAGTRSLVRDNPLAAIALALALGAVMTRIVGWGARTEGSA